jgi:hypothetical protein
VTGAPTRSPLKPEFGGQETQEREIFEFPASLGAYYLLGITAYENG